MADRITAEIIGNARSLASAATENLSSAHQIYELLKNFNDDDIDQETHIRRFLIIVAGLELNRTTCESSLTEIANFHQLATNILKLMSIKPRSSRFSFLYSELEIARSCSLFGLGDTWLALSGLQSARSNATRGCPAEVIARIALLTAQCFLRLGMGRLAREGFDLPILKHLSQKDIPENLIGSLTLHRLQNNQEAFLDQAKIAQAFATSLPPASKSDFINRITWEGLIFDSNRSTSALEIVRAEVSRNSRLANPERVLRTYILRFATNERHSIPGFTNTESIRRHFKLSTKSNGLTGHLLRIAKVLEACHDNAIPLEIRLTALDELLPALQHAPDVDSELIALAASTKWLRAAQQNLRASAAQAVYQELSQQLTEGKSIDALGVFNEPAESAWDKYSEASITGLAVKSGSELQSFTALRQSTASRAFELTRVGFSLLPKLLKHRFRLLFADKEEAKEIQRIMDSEITRHLVQKIGALKGPIVKLAQMTSVIHAALPDSVYQSIVKLRDSSPGMTPETARSVVKAELGQDAFTQRFSEWDDEPIATGSVGQVHRAVTKSGIEVAVKVQYPGIEESIRSDMKLLRLVVVPIYRVIFPSVDLNAIATTVENIVIQECDFTAEATSQASMRLHAENQKSKMSVPKPHPEVSTARVLTMDMAEGRRFTEFVAEASQDERNKAGASIAAFLIRRFFSGEEFSADPHPGNFMFGENGEITMLDFGAMGKIPEERLKLFVHLIKSVKSGDLNLFKPAFTAFGYVENPDTFDYETDLRNAEKVMAPILNHSEFQFNYDFFTDVFAYYGLASSNRKKVKFESQDVTMWRFLIGIQVLLCELESKINISEIFWSAVNRNQK